MKSLLTALGLVFVAELGDKTQLVAIGFATRHRAMPVLAGVTLAYAVTNLISVALGGAVGTVVSTRVVGLVGGALFLGFAGWTLSSGDQGDADGSTELAGRALVMSVAAAIFVAELGDKTMLATATLAAKGDPFMTWVGATVGIVLSGTMGVLIGRSVGARLPQRTTRLGSAALFAIFGIVFIATSV